METQFFVIPDNNPNLIILLVVIIVVIYEIFSSIQVFILTKNKQYHSDFQENPEDQKNPLYHTSEQADDLSMKKDF